MDNPEEVMQILERFNVSRNPEITAQLEEYITFVARTGDSVYAWSLVKNLFREKLVHVITDFYNETPTKGKRWDSNNNKRPAGWRLHAFAVSELPQYPNVDPFNYETMKKTLIEKLDSFAAAPFTIQRISELLSDPRKQYSRIDKFMRAVEKTILVVSTVPPGRHRSESENGDSLDSALNGDFSSEVNVDIDMEQGGSFTKELSAKSPSRKEQNLEVSAASQETITITKNNASPSKEGEAGASESVIEKNVDGEKEKVVEVEKKEVETAPTAEVAALETKSAETEASKEGDTNLVTIPADSKMESDVVKVELPVVQVLADVPCEVTISEPKIDDAPLNEPIKSADDEILVDTSEIISETTPLAALENIVAIRTEPAAEVIEQIAAVIVANPDLDTVTDTVAPVVEAAKEESDAKRLKMSDVTESSSESSTIVETVIEVEQSVPELPSVAEIVEEKPAEAAAVEEVSSPEPLIEQQNIIASSVVATEAIVAIAEPIIEEKIDEPLPEIAEIPIEIVPPTEQEITESSLTAMDTVPTITENTMSLDEDEPPTLELEMTPIANEMDTDEAEAAPMDFEDDAEPMDQ